MDKSSYKDMPKGNGQLSIAFYGKKYNELHNFWTQYVNTILHRIPKSA